jgi:hypothetical protein
MTAKGQSVKIIAFIRQAAIEMRSFRTKPASTPQSSACSPGTTGPMCSGNGSIASASKWCARLSWIVPPSMRNRSAKNVQTGNSLPAAIQDEDLMPSQHGFGDERTKATWFYKAETVTIKWTKMTGMSYIPAS